MFGKRCLLKTNTRLQSTTMDKIEQQQIRLLGVVCYHGIQNILSLTNLLDHCWITFMLPDFPQKMFDSWYSVCKLIFSIIKKNAKSAVSNGNLLSVTLLHHQYSFKDKLNLFSIKLPKFKSFKLNFLKKTKMSKIIILYNNTKSL